MPTKLHRYYGAGYLHFITTSCYRRRPLLGTPQSRDLFLDVMEQVRRRYRFVVVGYVVMPEHVHLLFSEPERGDPSIVMKVLKQSFARRLLGRGAGPCVLRHSQGCPIRRGFRRVGTNKRGHTGGFAGVLTVAARFSPFSTAFHKKNSNSCDVQPLLRMLERASSPYAREPDQQVLHHRSP